MRDVDAQPVDGYPDSGLDEWLADRHRRLSRDLGATLDLEAGLAEVLISARHADLVTDLDRSLDVDAGLAEVLSAGRDVTPRPVISGWARHRVAVAAAFIGLAALAAIVVPVWSRMHKAQPGPSASVPCVVNAIATDVPAAVPPALSIAPDAGVDVLHYGVYPPTPAGAASCAGTGTVQFRVAVTARGSGIVRVTSRWDGSSSSDPVQSDVLTFTGRAQETKTVEYTVPRSCHKGQMFTVSMTTELAKRAAPIGASQGHYDAICQ